MRGTTATRVLALVAALASTTPAQFGLPGREFDRTGQAGMTFLKIGPIAGPAGMADAYTGLSVGAMGAFYNPGGVGFVDNRFDAVVSQVSWLADIGITSGAIAVPVRLGAAGRIAVVALSFVSMDYGDIYGTVRKAGDAVYLDAGMLQPSESALGLTLARQFTDKFSVGVTVKYVSQALPWFYTGTNTTSPTATPREFSANVFVFDGGTMYRTGFGSSVISMSIRNYAPAQKYVRDRFLLPMTFRIGVATDLLDLMPELQRSGHRLMVSGDGIHPPDHPEKFAVGGEYSFQNIAFLRGGYSINYDAQSLSLGAGLRYSYASMRGGFDYAYSDFGASLGAVHYFTFSFAMD